MLVVRELIDKEEMLKNHRNLLIEKEVKKTDEFMQKRVPGRI
jgi:hypothetical protein